MKDEKMKGILPALLTAFGEGGVDSAKQRALVERLADSGVHGLYVGGSSGEMVLMTEDERRFLLETVMEAAGNLTVIAHVGSLTTEGSLELARHAESCGAHALSSVTPLYYRYGFREVKHYYERLAAETALPVVIYNIPALTGSTLNTAQLMELLSIPNVGGMKFTASDFFQLERLRTAFPDKIFYNGSDEMLLSGLAAGADGGIGSTYNIQPKTILAVYDAFRRGDLPAAQAAQTRANAVIEVILRHGVLPSCKELLRLTGLDIGRCREPFLPVEEEGLAELEKLAGIIR